MDASALDYLRRQIEDHQKHDSSQSLVKRAIGYVWGKDEQSLEDLQVLYREADRKQKAGDNAGLAQLTTTIKAKIRSDREEVSWQDEISHYGSGFLKTAGLFMLNMPVYTTIHRCN